MRLGKEDEIRRLFKESLSTLIADGGSYNDVKGLYSVLSAASSVFLAEKKREQDKLHYSYI